MGLRKKPADCRNMEDHRIWELDALRGIAILGVVILHFLYDLQTWYGLPTLEHWMLRLAMTHGGKIFVVLSGLCAGLGSHSGKRGCTVLAFGLLISFVTGLLGGGAVIRFGILHLLGMSMILWPMVRRLPWWGLLLLGGAVIWVGGRFAAMTVTATWLYPLGLCRGDFFSADYFPLCPYFGWFLLGGALEKTLYRTGQTLLPRVPAEVWPIRFLRHCGRHSLWIYLLHQPVLLVVCRSLPLVPVGQVW